MPYIVITSSNDLYHHGILGMKWGVRRYQNKDGSLTAKGKKRYSEQPAKKKDAKNSKRPFFEDFADAYAKAYKREYPKASDKQAAEYGKRMAKIQKTMMIIGGVTVAAAVGVGVYKYAQYSMDGKISTGKMLQRVGGNPSGKLHDVFYASFGSHDNARYEGLYGHQLAAGNYGIKKTPYKLALKATKDIKVASPKKAIAIYDEFAKSNSLIGGRFGTGKAGYEKFNRRLVDKNLQKSANEFFELLKSKGYSAIVDVNDKKYSGFNARKPLIFFDNSVLSMVKATEITDTQAKYYKEIAKISLEDEFAKSANSAMIIGGSIGAYSIIPYAGYKINKYSQNKEKDESK